MKKRSIVVLVLVPFVLSQVSFPSPSKACPVMASLWHFVAQSDLIVLATVESAEADPTGANPMESAIEQDRVVLRVIDTWKGPFLREVIVTSYPEQYTVGDLVVAFLEQGELRAQRWQDAIEGIDVDAAPQDMDPEEEGVQTPVDEWSAQDQAKEMARIQTFAQWARGRWLSVDHESTSTDAEKAEVFKELVVRAIELQSGGTTDEATRIDWLVSAAARRSTRHYGLDELPRSSLGHSAEGEERPPELLTQEQLARLADGFRSEPSVDASDVAMLEVLASYPDIEVDRTAASLVEAGLLLKPIPAWVLSLVAETLKRYGDDFGDRIGRDDLPDPLPGERDTLPAIWRQARAELGIPAVVPAAAPE
jgi:hypothetical protein